MELKRVDIVEVGPRDGFQPIAPHIDTQQKIALISRLHAAGLRRMEATAFVSPVAVPQLADAAEVLTFAQIPWRVDSERRSGRVSLLTTLSGGRYADCS